FGELVNSGFDSTNVSNETFCVGAGVVSPLKAALSFGTRPASIQLKLPLLTLSVGRTQPSTIHCCSVSRSVSKIPSTVLTRQTSGCALMGFVLWGWQVEVGLPSGWKRAYWDQTRCLNTKALNLAASIKKYRPVVMQFGVRHALACRIARQTEVYRTFALKSLARLYFCLVLLLKFASHTR